LIVVLASTAANNIILVVKELRLASRRHLKLFVMALSMDMVPKLGVASAFIYNAHEVEHTTSNNPALSMPQLWSHQHDHLQAAIHSQRNHRSMG
jgi:hypothetical protein